MARRKKIQITVRYKYEDGALEPLYGFMQQRIGYDLITLKMTQAEYDLFSDDLDYDDLEHESFYGSHFRPTNDQTDNCKLNWVFAGKLNFKIKIITE